MSDRGRFVVVVKINKGNFLASTALSTITVALISASASEIRAQTAASRDLPAINVDESQPPPVEPISRSLPASRQGVRTVRRQSAVRPRAPLAQNATPIVATPVAPANTMGTTRAIGAPAPVYAGGQVAQGGTLGLLGSMNTMNVPSSTVNFKSKLIADQQARTAADTLINDSSIRLTTGSN